MVDLLTDTLDVIPWRTALFKVNTDGRGTRYRTISRGYTLRLSFVHPRGGQRTSTHYTLPPSAVLKITRLDPFCATWKYTHRVELLAA